jgi:putative peptidoglycan lipid II flippase
MSIARHVAVVGIATLASRVLGFVRDVAIAGLFGTGFRADAFVIAFQFSNLIRRLLTEGALNSAFVPLYLRRRGEAGEDAAGAFAGKVVGTATLALLALAVMFAFAMPLLMLLLAPGFVDSPPRMTLAIEVSRLMLPYLVLAGPVAVLMGVLNANHRYSTAALAAVTFNVVVLCAIAAVIVLHWGDSDRSAWLIAAAVALAGLFQLALVGVAVWAGPEKATPLGLLPSGEAMRFAALAVPGLLASGIPQLSMIAGAMIASDWPGAVSYLYYANRLIELPLGIVGIAIGTVMTPALTHAVRGTDRELEPRTMRHGIELSLGLALPAAIALLLLAYPIVRILFERGAFTAADSSSTASMLGAFALGLPGHVLVKALSPVFFAREDTRTPMVATLIGLAVVVAFGLAFMAIGRPAGIALSIAISGWVSALMLWLVAHRRGLLSRTSLSFSRIARIALAAILMGAAVRAAAILVGLFDLDAIGRLAAAGLLALVIAFGLAFYLSCLWLFGILGLKDFARN